MPKPKAAKPAPSKAAPSKAFVMAWLDANPKVSGRELCRRAGLSESIVKMGLQPNRLAQDFSDETLAALAPVMATTVPAMLGEAPSPAGKPAKPGAAPSSPASVAPLAAASAGDGFQRLRIDQVAPDPKNPRKYFDKTELESLAGDIADKGIHTPAVVRPGAKPGQFILIAGERRLRAAQLLVKKGIWKAPDDRFPAVVKNVDARAALDIAMSENVQRASMHPLEEGAGFRRMRDEFGVKTDEIAERFGKTVRWVQLRIALDEKLSPKAKEKFLRGEMRLAAAEALCRAPKASQDAVLKSIGIETTEADVAEELQRGAMDIKTAIFEHDLYKGDMLLDDNGQAIAFADGKQAAILQRKAIDAKLKALGKEWSFVEEMPYEWWRPEHDGFVKSDDKAKAGCFFHVDRSDLKLKLIKGWARKPAGKSAAGKGGKDAPAKPAEAFSKVHLQWAQDLRTLALQDGILRQGPQLGLAIAVFALLTRNSAYREAPVRLRVEHGQAQARVQNETVDAALSADLKPMIDAKIVAKTPYHGFACKPGKEAELLAWLLQSPAVPAILTALVARVTGDWCDNLPRAGAYPLLQALAGAAGADPKTRFKLDEAYLQRFTRAGLERIAASAVRDTKTAGPMPAKKGEVIAWLLQHADKAWTPPEIEFLSAADILKRANADKALIKEAVEEQESEQEDVEYAAEEFDAEIEQADNDEADRAAA